MSIVFLYTDNEHSGNKIKNKVIPYIIPLTNLILRYKFNKRNSELIVQNIV